MTTLNLQITDDRWTQIAQAGVYFQIVAFDSADTTPYISHQWEGSALATSTDWSYDAGTGMHTYVGGLDLTPDGTAKSGKLYFIIQSGGSTYVSITAQSQINWENATDASGTQGYQFKYDSIEFNLENASGDAANLTSVSGFGLPMELSNSNGSRSYSIVTGPEATSGTLLNDLNGAATGTGGVVNFTEGPLAGQALMAISPTTSVADTSTDAYSFSDWDSYITAVKAFASDIVLSGLFNGAPDVGPGTSAAGEWRNAGFFNYSVEWDDTKQGFWLVPEANSQVQGYIFIYENDLAAQSALNQGIYSSTTNVYIYTNQTDADPYAVYDLSDDPTGMVNIGANNQWGKVLQQFTNGFTAGYYGFSGASLNSGVTADIDLNKNYNWDPTYAFGNNGAAGSSVLGYDPYSKVFFDNSNSYGSTYSDALMAAYSQGGPLLSLNAPGTSTNLATLNLTIYGDTDTPSGYTTPVINNYIAPTSGTNYEIGTYQGNGSSITLDFGSGQALAFREDVPIFFNFITGYDGTTPVWTSVQLGSSTVTPWQTWTFNSDFTVTGNGGAGQTASSLVIVSPPVSASGVNWYQIVVGTGDTQKTYNLYATTNGTYEFVDPASTSDVTYAADGLATVTPGALRGDGSLLTFTVQVTGAVPTLDLSMLEWNTDPTYIAGLALPSAPVAGTLGGSGFAAIAGQSSTTAPSITVSTGEVAFAWTGLNSDSNTTSWISGYTNKIYGLQTALLSFAGGTGIAPIVTQGDIDGQWTSGVSQQLGNGTYTVTMTQYLSTDTAFATPIGRESAPLTLQVNLSDLQIAHTTTGLNLEDDSSGTSGNWVSLQTLSSSLSPEATLIIYRVNGSGQMIDGQGNVVSDIDDATMAYVGSVHSDSGATLFNGSQMVYLGLGQEMRFALQTGEDSINMLPSFTATTQGDGSVVMNVGGLQLAAEVQNTLDAGNNLASVQRIYDLPMVYLTNGQELSVEVAGSASNTNELHFVRFDIDFRTGDISVGGVSYGNTPEFHAALMAHLDSGYAASHGGGTFTDSEEWTVSGADGYYAPVLITQSGEIFVPGTGNSGGNEYIRIFGENTFGFEDLSAAQGSDFDYNDMVMRLVPHI